MDWHMAVVEIYVANLVSIIWVVRGLISFVNVWSWDRLVEMMTRMVRVVLLGGMSRLFRLVFCYYIFADVILHAPIPISMLFTLIYIGILW